MSKRDERAVGYLGTSIWEGFGVYGLGLQNHGDMVKVTAELLFSLNTKTWESHWNWWETILKDIREIMSLCSGCNLEHIDLEKNGIRRCQQLQKGTRQKGMQLQVHGYLLKGMDSIIL